MNEGATCPVCGKDWEDYCRDDENRDNPIEYYYNGMFHYHINCSCKARLDICRSNEDEWYINILHYNNPNQLNIL